MSDKQEGYNLIRDTRERAQKLIDLLDNPEPGLAIWNSSVCSALNNIAELAPGYKKK